MRKTTRGAAFAFDKGRFFADIGYRPHPGQWPVHNSNARRRVVACGVRWGKTLCAAMEGLAAALVPAERSIGWVVAPTYDLADKVYREIVSAVGSHLKHRLIALKESERRLLLRNMGGGISEIRAKSADNPVSLLGEGLSWVIVDEAARLKPNIWQGHLSQRLIDKKGWALLISTPRGKGYLHALYRRGQDPHDTGHESWNLPSWNNPHLDRDVIEAERALLPEQVFRQEFGGEFLEGAGQVFRNIRECASGEWRDPVPAAPYVAGLDLAKVADYSVLTIMDAEARVVFVDRFHRIDWSQQVNRVHTACGRYSDASILVDSTGAGEPVFESLRKAGCRVEPYTFTAKSKSQLIDNLALMLERGDIVLPRPDLWPEGVDELEAFEFNVTESGNVSMNAPSGTHDDCVISLALAAWQRRPSKRCMIDPDFQFYSDEGAILRARAQRHARFGGELAEDALRFPGRHGRMDEW